MINLMQYKKPLAMISDFNLRIDNTQKKKKLHPKVQLNHAYLYFITAY